VTSNPLGSAALDSAGPADQGWAYKFFREPVPVPAGKGGVAAHARCIRKGLEARLRIDARKPPTFFGNVRDVNAVRGAAPQAHALRRALRT